MRLRRAKIITGAALAILGVGMLVVAFFAYQLHLDNNRVMGIRRVILAYLGGFSLLLAMIIANSARLSRLARAAGRLPAVQGVGRAARWVGQPFSLLGQALERAGSMAPFGYMQRHPGWWAVIGAALVILASWWYITSGTLVSWVSYSAYYDKQADAYLAGQLALLEKPPAALLALAEPYVWQNRETVGAYIWDASLYQGKYFLYWGPVPALFAAGVKLVHPVTVEDQYLLMFFISGLAISTAALLHWLRQTCFPRAPGWTVLLFTLLAGLNAPVFWLVNRPDVYETAIAGGQFFLILGLLAALRGLAPTPPGNGLAPTPKGRGLADENRRWLAAAGLAWGLSAGCRVNNAVAIAWIAGLCLLFLLANAKKRPGWLGQAVCLVLPLGLCAAGFAWYNDARFGSILETGHRYQLTGPALPTDYKDIMSSGYMLPNLYNALIRPFVIDGKEFPFIFTPFIKQKMWPWFIRLPSAYYYSEPITGVFPTIPAFFLLLLPVLKPLGAFWRWVHEAPRQARTAGHPLYSWAWWMVGGALLFSTVVLLLFISSSMRYLADIVPLASLLIAMCLWWALDYLHDHPAARRWLLWLAAGLGLASILIGLLVNFQNGDQRFHANNPELYRAIARFFTGQK